MSGPVDVRSAMRVAEAYCYDAGAATAAKNMKEARAAVAELLDALADFDGMGEPSMPGTPPRLRRLREAFARVQGGAA